MGPAVGTAAVDTASGKAVGPAVGSAMGEAADKAAGKAGKVTGTAAFSTAVVGTFVRAAFFIDRVDHRLHKILIFSAYKLSVWIK